jgi:hypothetical protein
MNFSLIVFLFQSVLFVIVTTNWYSFWKGGDSAGLLRPRKGLAVPYGYIRARFEQGACD